MCVFIHAGFEIKALKGFPGPFAKFVQKTIGAKGILKLLGGAKNRRAKWTTAIAYCKPNAKPIVVCEEDAGTITQKSSGKFGGEWDKIFIMEGQKKTQAHWPEHEAINNWRTERWRKLALIILNSKEVRK